MCIRDRGFSFNIIAQNDQKQSEICTGVGTFIFGARVAGDVVGCVMTTTGYVGGILNCYDLINALRDPEASIEGHAAMACFWKVNKKKLNNGDIEAEITINGPKEEVDAIMVALKLDSKEPNSCSIKY